MRIHPALFALPFAAFGCVSSSNNEAPDAGASPVDAAVPTPDGGTVPAACPAPTSGPTLHPGSVNADETWTADKSPHILQYDTSIYATVTLEPCAVVRVAPKATVTINPKGAIVGAGTATTPILIGARDDGKPFAVIRAMGGSMRLEYATIEGGGDPLNTSVPLAGMLYAQPGGDPATSAADAFSFKNVTVKGSATNGIVLTSQARFSADSTALTVTGSGEYPISIWPSVVGSVPPGTYTGNTQDEILLPGGAQGEVIATDQTMHERGVPYHVGIPASSGVLAVGRSNGAAAATLTIEPGVVVRFKKGGFFYVEEFSSALPATGALVAKGTADKPIRFTSAEPSPAPGDWIGLTFGSIVDPRTALDNVWIEYAGAKTSGDSGGCTGGLRAHAVQISGPPAPTHAFITNSKILHAPNGIAAGWRGVPVDFSPTNTFDDVGGCKITSAPDANNSCAAGPPCALP